MKLTDLQGRADARPPHCRPLPGAAVQGPRAGCCPTSTGCHSHSRGRARLSSRSPVHAASRVPMERAGLEVALIGSRGSGSSLWWPTGGHWVGHTGAFPIQGLETVPKVHHRA